MALKSILFDIDKYKGTLIQHQDTRIDLLNGSREESVLYSFRPLRMMLSQYDNYLRLDIWAQPEELNRLRECNFGQMDIGKNLISRKEIKCIPNPENPLLALILTDYVLWSVNPAPNGNPSMHMSYYLCDTKQYGFVINNGIQIPLQYGKKAFADISRLAAEDQAFLDEIMLRQQRQDWVISSTPTKKESVEQSALDGIRAVFDALSPDEQRIIGMDELKIIKGAEDSRQELEQMIGMDNIKQELEILEARLRYKHAMQKQGYMPESTASMHMCFMGAPGTGKTTVARVITGVLSKYGYIKKNKCIEINARQLIGSYVGQTPFRTATILKAAMGGVLFVDEAYSLLSDQQGDFYGPEAIAQLLKEMEDSRSDLIVILAGYERDMQRFLDVNEGMRSRINRYIHFENYTAEESMEIFLLTLRKEQMRITRPALEKLLLLMKKACMTNGFSNGRFVRNLYEKVLEEHSIYIMNNAVTGAESDTIGEAAVSDRLCSQILDAMR